MENEPHYDGYAGRGTGFGENLYIKKMVAAALIHQGLYM